jgi:hypothetical protein
MILVVISSLVLCVAHALPIPGVESKQNVMFLLSESHQLGECEGRGESIRCVGLGPHSTDPQHWVGHLELSTWLWTPTKEAVLAIFPNIQVIENAQFQHSDDIHFSFRPQRTETEAYQLPRIPEQ